MTKLLNLINQFQLYIIGGFAALSLGLAVSTYIYKLKYEAADTRAEACEAGRAADQKAVRTAQEQAELEARLAVERIERENERKAQTADARYRDLNERYRASVLRYSRTPNPGATGPTNTAGPADPAESVDGPSEGTHLLITTDDALICAENTARLQSGHEWALSLQQTE